MGKSITQFLAGILLFTACGTSAFAADYFPLHTGDARYLYAIPWHVGEEVAIDSISYFEIYYRDLLWCHVRQDSTGKIFRRMPGRTEELYYDLSAEVGQNWLYRESDNVHFKVTLESKTDTVKTAFGEFTDCYRYSFIAVPVTHENGTTSFVIDADYAEILAPDIGLVKEISLDWGIESPLLKAFVNGKKIPVDSPPLLVTRSYPEGGKTGVSKDTEIRAFFSFGTQPLSINTEPFTVVSRKNGRITGTFSQRTMMYDDSITFHPDQPLSSDDTIEITVRAGIVDFAGDTLAEPYRFSFSTGEVAAVSDRAAPQFSLDTRPNPFNPSTTITYTTPAPGPVSLTVYDVTGQKVAELAQGFHSAGTHTAIFDGSRLASGVYFCTLRAGNRTESRKMLLLR